MIKTYKPNDTARIKAMLFTAANLDAAVEWAGKDLDEFTRGDWQVNTLEGWVAMPFDHYLIKGTNNEFYPCAPGVFRKRWVETRPLEYPYDPEVSAHNDEVR